MTATGYAAIAPPTALELSVSGLKYRCYTWGDASGIPVWMLHGWADCALSFQFMADHFGPDYYLLAPDWRGFGDTGRARENYWFPDYLADLEQLIALLTPGRPVILVGHSMGGNIAGLYAGVRPTRIAALVCLDAAGMSTVPATEAPARYADWLDQLQQAVNPRDFASLPALADHVRRLAPRLSVDHAGYIAKQWSHAMVGDQRRLKMDPRHRRVNPVLYRRDEAIACWRRVAAPTLFVFGSLASALARQPVGELETELRAYFRACEVCVLDAIGHMLHMEAPAAVTDAIRSFLIATRCMQGADSADVHISI